MTVPHPLTTSFGIPVPDNQNSLTVGARGPVLLEDFHLVEKLAHFNRERIPERVVHAKGAGAYGYLEVTEDMRAWTCADFLQNLGQRTEVFVRFSTVGGEKGSADTARDPRGFAVKFYTTQGNYDLVGNNTPVFFIRDPQKFPDLIHSQKRHPQTNCKDPNAIWDFFSLTPESIHQVTILYSDRGTPRSYRHMNGYGSHTFMWYNAQGERFWVKYHCKTDQGVQCLTREEAAKIAGIDPDHATRDLFGAIADGEFPTWTVKVQIMPVAEAEHYHLNPFDLTRVWPHRDYPLQTLGKLVLDRNPENYFAEVEQAAFSPSNVVPGIGFSPDKMLQARIFAYPDAHRYRLGANYANLPVNCPHAAPVNHYQRDGAMRFDGNGGATVNYEPNSLGGPQATPDLAVPPYEVSGTVGRWGETRDQDDYRQAGELYRMMDAGQKERLVANLVADMRGAKPEIQRRQVGHFLQADKEYGQRVAEGLGLGG